jgi:hypothetical protein
MQEKPPHELDPGQAHHFLPIRISVIPEPEIHSLIFLTLLDDLWLRTPTAAAQFLQRPCDFRFS